jgi:hypothetical protein
MPNKYSARLIEVRCKFLGGGEKQKRQFMARNGTIRRGNGNSSLPVYPIRTVSKITGVGEGTLRAWEVRYGLIAPARTPGGHRIFSENDINVVLRIKRMLHVDGLSLAGVQRVLSSPEEVRHGR